jgi:hypothetical protein
MSQIQQTQQIQQTLQIEIYDSKKIQFEVDQILNKNKINDLKKFLDKRSCLNWCNSIMIYLFHIIQTLGIIFTSMSATNGSQKLLWIGIILNMSASIIQIYEKINNDQMKKIMFDIQTIKNGSYIDESPLIDMPPSQYQQQIQSQPQSEQIKQISTNNGSNISDNV